MKMMMLSWIAEAADPQEHYRRNVMMMTDTAQTTVQDDDRDQRRAAYERLKAEVKKPNTGYRATVLCMMISHSRGKLHCRSYHRFHCGWRTDQAATAKVKELEAAGGFETEDYKRYAARLGSGCEERWSRWLWAKSIISSLDEQAEFLQKALKEDQERATKLKRVLAEGRRKPYPWEQPQLDDELRGICERVIAAC